jgi:hypothetical protein
VEIIHKSQIARLKMRPDYSTILAAPSQLVVIRFAPSAAARPCSIGNGLMERNSKRIAREWNRGIEAEIHRLAPWQDDGPWKILVWVLLEAGWLGALVVVLGLFSRLH